MLKGSIGVSPSKSIIFLIGMMGSGKTTVGEILAKKLHLSFIDIDERIEMHFGCLIPSIFQIEGEKGFREKESTILNLCVQEDNTVVSTGGGLILSAKNRRTLKDHGIVVYLTASESRLFDRIRSDLLTDRPLLKTKDPYQIFQMLFSARKSYYREVADIMIDTSTLSCGETAELICSKLEGLGKAYGYHQCSSFKRHISN